MSHKINELLASGCPVLVHTEIARSDRESDCMNYFKGAVIFCWFTISGDGRELVGLKLCEMVLAI